MKVYMSCYLQIVKEHHIFAQNEQLCKAKQHPFSMTTLLYTMDPYWGGSQFLAGRWKVGASLPYKVAHFGNLLRTPNSIRSKIKTYRHDGNEMPRITTNYKFWQLGSTLNDNLFLHPTDDVFKKNYFYHK